MNIIAVDIETSGFDACKCSIWQIGAIDLANTHQQFLEEARVDDGNIIEKGAMKVCGKTESQLRDPYKQSEKELLEHFFNWCKKVGATNCLVQNPGFDIGYLTQKALYHGLKIPFHYRTFDLHSIAQAMYWQKHQGFLEENHKSSMGLRTILRLVGIKDTREAHNALEDCKLTAECFWRLTRGKGLFSEYKDLPLKSL